MTMNKMIFNFFCRICGPVAFFEAGEIFNIHPVYGFLVSMLGWILLDLTHERKGYIKNEN